MITPSFSLTATERVLPRLALDFTTASLDQRVTFTRTGNTATVTNSSGFVVPINADLPRFDFNPITLACNGLLIEESRTNLATYSNTFTNAAWTKARSSITANDIVSPDGTLDGDKLVEDTTATNSHFIEQSAAIVSGTTYSYSVFAKQAERSQIRVRSFMTGSASADFNLSNGTVSNASGTVSQSITSIGNGWYRCTIVASSSTTGTGFFSVFLMSGGSVTYTGNGVSGAYIWGAQLEAGAFPTSYIPTVASTVTRNADVATMTGTNFSDWYTATTGAASVWAIPQTATGTRPVIQFDDTTANEIIALRGNVANPELYIVDGGTPQAQIDAGTIVANTAYKLTGAWNTDSCAAAQNGAAVVTDDTATIPTPTQLRIGSDGTNYASAWVQKIYYYPQRLINAEVQAFSK